MTTDDLKLIPGIGPATERRLRRVGIFTYAQLAAQSPVELAKAVRGLSAKRVTEQKWIIQARKLASRSRQSSSRDEKVETTRRQRYATFALELLLDEKNRVRRTHVRHIQNGNEATWVTWQASRLVDFVVDQAGLELQALAAESTIGKEVARGRITAKTPEKQSGENLEPETREQAEEQKIRSSPEAISSGLRLEVNEMQLYERENRDRFPIPLSAKITFQLTSSENNYIGSKHSRFVIKLFACDTDDGRITVLAEKEQTLLPDQFAYSKTLDFSAPMLGRYKLVVLILLPDEDIFAVKLGPTLRVIL